MELRQLRYFMAVAEAGNFSRAAARMHVSQPPLSTQVGALEAELGVRLFARSNRGATLTAAGQVFLAEVQAAMARLEQAREKARRADEGDAGLLAVGFVSIADYSILPPALMAYRAAFPRVEVQLHELTTDAQLRELRAGRLDVGIALGPVDEPDLVFVRLLREELVLALPERHPGARAARAELRAFARESFIVPPRDVAPGLYDLIIRHCSASGFVPRITQHARQMQTVIGLVSSGMGCALVPASVRNLKRPGVVYRSLRGPSAQVELGLLEARDGGIPLRARFARSLQAAAAAARRPQAARALARSRG